MTDPITDPALAHTILAAAAERRAERRRFIKLASGGIAVAGGLSLLAACGGNDDDDNPITNPTPTPTASATSSTAEVDVLNFALQLEYLEAQFYAFAATGQGLPATLTAGTGTAGAVTGGRRVAFTDPVVAAYAREIAGDERAHVAFLRQVLGSAAVAMPAIDLSAAGPFTAAARAAGIAGANDTFDPYATDENFLLGAYIFEDVGVTAYKGASSTLVFTPGYQEATAGLLAAEAYHAGLIRTTLYQKGLATPSLRTKADAISNARDLLDGVRAPTATPTPTPSPTPSSTATGLPTGVDNRDLDQGITGTADVSNIVPADDNGIAFSRTVGQVLNIAFLSNAAVDKGGFFPAGVNGNLKISAASGG
ncbi:ferritin-like domain-containing protein [Sphingomonas sp. HHU CXW]|uniref:Ferritin-like domain-containing protein n=1 Tax=Sphingomonas hominis TaxID=2741495 RepID=A0ABX2JKE7_9SPHN|nr:ferritin-like domain-containing protein [Sphingomonas hominis]NTS65955.1 ferritin-like domain-containing protein [Sphingomonas hominis]